VLNESLNALGMNNAFEKKTANLYGMDGRDWLYIQTVWQKAFVEVNEEGTEAAAVTGGCFPSGTPVLTEGGLRAIDSVDPGTKVCAFDLARGECTLARMLNRRSRPYEGEMITMHAGGDSIRCTASQPFYVVRGDRLSDRPLPREVPTEEQEQLQARHGRWVEAGDLRVGDLLRTKTSEDVAITDLSSRRDRIEVYSLDVEGHHNFAVLRSGALVHNKGQKSAEPPPNPKEFLADHSFLFLLRDTGTKSILFMGRISNPLAK
jgi:hypothetical protein